MDTGPTPGASAAPHPAIGMAFGMMIPQKSARSRSPERRQAACAGWAAPPRRDVTTCRVGWRPRAFPATASAGVPSGAVGRDDGRMRGMGCRPRALPAIPFPPRWRPDAFPVMAPAGIPRDGLSRQGMRCPRWRSDARFARVGGRAAAITGLNQALAAHPMVRSCLPNAGVQPRPS